MCVCDGVCMSVISLLISQSIDYKYGVCLQHEMSGEVRYTPCMYMYMYYIYIHVHVHVHVGVDI